MKMNYKQALDIRSVVVRKEKEQNEGKTFSNIEMSRAWDRTTVKELRQDNMEYLKGLKGKEYFESLKGAYVDFLYSYQYDEDRTWYILSEWAKKKYVRERCMKSRLLEEEAYAELWKAKGVRGLIRDIKKEETK